MASAVSALDVAAAAVHHAGVASYRQYCPVARATEIVAERWTLLIVRNLLFGAETFTAIARGVPTMSRSMLVRRLSELERAGVISVTPKTSGQGSRYRLTDAGRDLLAVIDELGDWAERWVDVLPEHNDPGFALWAWCQVQLAHSRLPAGRVVVHVAFPDQPPGNRDFWLLIAQEHGELCLKDPGGDPDLRVVARSADFVAWHRGALDWREAVRSGGIAVYGDPALARAFPTWNTHETALTA